MNYFYFFIVFCIILTFIWWLRPYRRRMYFLRSRKGEANEFPVFPDNETSYYVIEQIKNISGVKLEYIQKHDLVGDLSKMTMFGDIDVISLQNHLSRKGLKISNLHAITIDELRSLIVNGAN